MARVIFKENCSQNINCKRRHLKKDIQLNNVSIKQNSKDVWGRPTIKFIKYMYGFMKTVLKNVLV